MSQYPFNLRGKQEHVHGTGLTNSQIQEGMVQRSREFVLTQGVIIADIAHHGYGDFKLQFVPTEGFSEGEATVASVGGAFGAGAASGAALGSIVPGAGTIAGARIFSGSGTRLTRSIVPGAGTMIAGALIGGVFGYFTANAIGDAIAPTIWTPVDYQGKFDTFCIMRVNEDRENALSLGKYCIEVTSKDRWTCGFIQPDLGQPLGPLAVEDGNLNQDSRETGPYILGPLESGYRPTLANIYYRGRGEFYAVAYSADGTHQCTVFQETGQFRVEEYQTEIKPGKEYFLYIGADGEWFITFTEGY